MSQPLYTHQRHSHQPVNVNTAHAAERLSVNDRIATKINALVGSMTCAYIFTFIGAAAFTGAVTGNLFLALTFGAVSSNLLQLVLLPIILLGQNIQARHGELQAEEAYQATLHALHDADQLIQHLYAQDRYALECGERLKQMETSVAQQRELLLFLLDHFQIEAQFTTANRLPVVRLDKHRVSIDEGELRVELMQAGYKAEVVATYDLPDLLHLYEKRPHRQEAEAVDGEL